MCFELSFQFYLDCLCGSVVDLQKTAYQDIHSCRYAVFVICIFVILYVTCLYSSNSLFGLHSERINLICFVTDIVLGD